MGLSIVTCLSLLVCFPASVIGTPINQHVILTSFMRVRRELKKAEIVPTVIDDFLPSLYVNISWPKATAHLGNTLTPKRLKDTPSVVLFDEDNPQMSHRDAVTYVVTLTDPDAPSRDDPKWSEMCHWIASGIPQKSAHGMLLEGLKLTMSGLTEIMPYKPPGPPKKTGKHRYVFIIFAPTNGTTNQLHLTKPSDRQHWGTGKEGEGVREWANENELTPIAANFVYSQNSEQ